MFETEAHVRHTNGTAGLAIYTAKLWGATKAVAREAREFSDKTLQHLVATAERELRGYVFPESPGDVVFGPPHMAPTVVLRFKNSGQTPLHLTSVGRGAF